MSGLRVAFPFMGVQVGGAVVSGAEMIRRLLTDGRVEPLVVMPREGPSAEVMRQTGVTPRFHDAEAVAATTLRRSTATLAGKVAAIPTYLAVHHNAHQLIEDLEIDVVHVNEDRLALPWGIAARRASVPLVWHVRQERPNPLLDGLRVRLASHIVFVSHANRINRFGRAGSRLQKAGVIYNVVDPERFRPTVDIATAKSLVNLDPERLTLTFVGNLFPRKRPEWVLRASAELQSEFPLQVLLVGAPLGEPTYLAELEKLRALAPEPDHIHFLGRRQDVAQLLQASDIATLPSIPLGEAFPRAVIEAMAAGVAVVATRVAGVPEALTDGVTGVLVDPANYREYVACLADLLRDGGERERLGKRARLDALDRFSGVGMADELVEIYTQALDRGQG